jgi:hypothetical protein
MFQYHKIWQAQTSSALTTMSNLQWKAITAGIQQGIIRLYPDAMQL